jgi:hypothetical protein
VRNTRLPPDPAVVALAKEIRLGTGGPMDPAQARESLPHASASLILPNVTADVPAPPSTSRAAGQKLVRVAAVAATSVAAMVVITLAASRSTSRPALRVVRAADCCHCIRE